MDPTPNGPNPEGTPPQKDSTPSGLNPKGTQPRRNSTPKGLNPERKNPYWVSISNGSTPTRIQPWKDSIPTGTQPQLGLNPDCDSTTKGVQPRMAQFRHLNIKFYYFLWTWTKVYLHKKWILKRIQQYVLFTWESKLKYFFLLELPLWAIRDWVPHSG